MELDRILTVQSGLRRNLRLENAGRHLVRHSAQVELEKAMRITQLLLLIIAAVTLIYVIPIIIALMPWSYYHEARTIQRQILTIPEVIGVGVTGNKDLSFEDICVSVRLRNGGSLGFANVTEDVIKNSLPQKSRPLYLSQIGYWTFEVVIRGDRGVTDSMGQKVESLALANHLNIGYLDPGALPFLTRPILSIEQAVREYDTILRDIGTIADKSGPVKAEYGFGKQSTIRLVRKP